MEDRKSKIIKQLKVLNAERGPILKEVMDYYKNTNRIQSIVLKSIKEKEKTIPEIAQETKLDKTLILWHLTALIKYGKAFFVPAKMGYMKYKAK